MKKTKVVIKKKRLPVKQKQKQKQNVNVNVNIDQSKRTTQRKPKTTDKPSPPQPYNFPPAVYYQQPPPPPQPPQQPPQQQQPQHPYFQIPENRPLVPVRQQEQQAFQPSQQQVFRPIAMRNENYDVESQDDNISVLSTPTQTQMPSLPYGLSPVSNTSDSLSRTITKEENAIASMPSFSPPPLSIVSNLEPSRISLSDPFDLVFQKEMAKMDTETNQKLNIIRKDEETKRMQNEEKKRIDKEEQNNWFKEKYQRDKETSLMMEEDWESEQLRDMDKKEKKYYSLPEFKSLLENPQELEDLLNEQQSLAEEIDYLAAQKDEDKLNANQIKEFKKLLKKYQQLESKIEKYKKLDIKQMRKEGYDLMTKIENKNNVFEPKEEEDIFGGGGGGPPTTRELTQRQKNLQKNNKDRQALRKTYTPLELEKRNLGELQSTAKSLGISLENVNTGKGTGKGSKRLKTKEQLIADIKKKQKSNEYYLKLNNPEEEIYVETK